MNKTRFALFLLLTSTWLGATGHRALAAQLVPLGPEDELWADIFSHPPAVAAQPGGSYVVAWDDESFSQIYGILPYLYVPTGEGPADENYGSLQSPIVPDVDAVTAGRQGFDVIWHSQWSYEDPPPPTLFYRGHLDLRGKPVGKPVRMGGAGTQWVWQVRGNGFMAGWSLPAKHGIAARRLSTSGQRTGPELRLNSRPVDSAGVSVVGLADASFVAVWLGVTPGSPGTSILRARRFSPSGKPLGPDFDVNAIPLGVNDPDSYYGFKVAAAPGGGFAVAWLAHRKIYLRWFNAAGTPLGPEVSAVTSGDFDDGGGPESMAFDDTGDLVLLWNLGYEELQLQLFDPQGTPLGTPVYVNSDFAEDPYERSHPFGGDLAWTGDSWVVAWVASIFPYDQNTMFVRRFAKK